LSSTKSHPVCTTLL